MATTKSGSAGSPIERLWRRPLFAGAATLGTSIAFVLAAQRRSHGSLWRAANLLTLSRAAAASLLAAQASVRRSGRPAWLALVLGCTLTDWLDGPLARRRGPTPLGAVLDLEADSWLTLWAAVAAWQSGALPAWSLGPPLLRYPVRFVRAAHRSMGSRPWQRAAGTMQMVALTGALSPWPSTRVLARRLAPAAAAAQLAALAADLTASPKAR